MEPCCECGHYRSTHKASVHREAARCQGNGCLCIQFKSKVFEEFQSNVTFTPLVPEVNPNSLRGHLSPYEGESDPKTWVLFLDTLDGLRATFSHPAHDTRLSISREEWVRLDRPGIVYTAPTTLNPIDA